MFSPPPTPQTLPTFLPTQLNDHSFSQKENGNDKKKKKAKLNQKDKQPSGVHSLLANYSCTPGLETCPGVCLILLKG